MKPFSYVACDSVEEACEALEAYPGDARVLAGGTDLLIELRRPGAVWPRALVDVSRVGALWGVEARGGGVRVGPMATHAELAASPVVRRAAGLLAAAAAAVGSPQIRNRGTVGGNVMNAATCADTVPPLVALGARLTLQSPRGRRTVAIAELFEKPYKTRARADEVLTDIEFAALPDGSRSAFVKLGRRNALAIARLSVAAVVRRDADGVIAEARLVPGAALPVWRRVAEAEAMLVGQRPSPELLAAAGRQVAEAMIGETGRRWSTEYKEPVIAVLVRRALEACCDGPAGEAA
jgi:CO/xanthine dehydrogenase FAD-binding subunit